MTNNSSASQQAEPAPIGAPERSIDDRLGEALRRWRHGLMRPLFVDLPQQERDDWASAAQSWRVTCLKDVGLKVEIEGEARP